LFQALAANKRLPLNNSDRLFWIGLSRVWTEWRSAPVIVKPATMIAGIKRHFEFGAGNSGDASQDAPPYHGKFAN
jgi:hypothetical protein